MYQAAEPTAQERIDSFIETISRPDARLFAEGHLWSYNFGDFIKQELVRRLSKRESPDKPVRILAWAGWALLILFFLIEFVVLAFFTPYGIFLGK